MYSSLVAGTQAGVTVDDNVRAFSELGWAPHAVGAQSDREMTTTVMGEEISFHLSAFGSDSSGGLPGLNLCGAGRVVCLIDPVGDVYACPFAIHENFLAGNILSDGGPVHRIARTARRRLH